jgi:hypothetical protein
MLFSKLTAYSTFLDGFTGGYYMPSVARMCTVLTNAVAGATLPHRIPKHPFSGAYSDQYLTYLPKTQLENKNTTQYLDEVEEAVLSNIANLVK